jgi:ribosomal protein S18 acetylase RimI-like enzyme
VLCVKKSNVRALRLYLQHGFEVVGHFTSDDAWALRRRP